MGGSSQYSSTIFSFAERLIEDPTLTKFYSQTTIQGMYQMQKAVLDMALQDMDDKERERHYKRVMLHHYSLFALGLNATHSNIIEQHLTDALRSSWTQQDVIDDIMFYFEELRNIFFGVNGHCPDMLESLKEDKAVILRFKASLATC